VRIFRRWFQDSKLSIALGPQILLMLLIVGISNVYVRVSHNGVIFIPRLRKSVIQFKTWKKGTRRTSWAYKPTFPPLKKDVKYQVRFKFHPPTHVLKFNIAGALSWQPHRHLWADCLENVGASTSHNPMSLHGLYRDRFTFLAIPIVTPDIWEWNTAFVFQRNLV
jgi:hypothetical protein